jgi:hypothetical protein
MSETVYHGVLWVLALVLGICTLPEEAPARPWTGRVRAKEPQDGGTSVEAES